jgi:nucleoside-diphosphate-sugar epimerase
MKILITGSAGFIGSALFERLRAAGHDVYGLDWRLPRWREPHPSEHLLDLCDLEGVKKLLATVRPTHVVHLAARIDISADSVVKYNANMDGVVHLAHAMQRAGSVQRALWTSSQLVSRIGRIPQGDTDYDPDSSYGESKVATERIVRGLDGAAPEWSILRPTTVWGPGMSDHYIGLLRYLERRIYFHAGAERVKKTFSFIHNATYQIQRLLEVPVDQMHGKTFYIADYEPIDLRGWCDALSVELIGRPARLMYSPAAAALAGVGDVLNRTVAPGFKFNSFRLHNIRTPYVFDMSSLESVVGPIPHGFDEAVKQTVGWYNDVVKRAAGAKV